MAVEENSISSACLQKCQQRRNDGRVAAPLCSYFAPLKVARCVFSGSCAAVTMDTTPLWPSLVPLHSQTHQFWQRHHVINPAFDPALTNENTMQDN